MKITDKLAGNILELIEEYHYLSMYGGILIDEDYGNVEDSEIEFNQFLRWLGAKNPIGDKRGWKNVKKNCIRKRKMSPEEAKKVVKEIMAKDINIFME